MQKRRFCGIAKSLWAWCIAAVMVISLSMPVSVQAAAAVLPTTSETPSEGCVFIGIPGKYITDTQAAINRINEIRYEACKEGVKSPSTGEALTLSDYVPIKWSAGIEAIARIRASEAGVAMNHTAIQTGHKRLNGESIWDFAYPAGGRVAGEIIAYNWGTSVISSINQWYDEKSDWVNNNTSAVTGHYTQMIDPSNTYIGLATFYSDSVYWRNTTLAHMGKGSGLDETPMPAVDSCIQTVEIKTEYISSISLTGNTTKLGSTSQCTLKAAISGMNKDVEILEGAVWTSSNSAVATVDNKGVVTGIAAGSTVITASAGSLTATCSVTVTCDHKNTEIRNKKDATTTAAGYTGDSYCKDCGSLLAKGTEIPKLDSPKKEETGSGSDTKKDENNPELTIPEQEEQSTGDTVEAVDANHNTYKLNKKKKTAVYSKADKGAKGTLTIPATVKVDGDIYKVTSISANACKNNKKITKVVIGSNVKTIGKNAFYKCTKLKTVTIGRNVKTIGKNAFYGCKKLNNIKILTKKLTKSSVGKNAFKGIYSKAKIQVPASKWKSYKTLLKARGVSGKASIKKTK